MRRVLLVLLVFLSGKALAEEENILPIRYFDSETIEVLGREMHRQDVAAARATDILFAQRLDLSKFPGRGWVVTEDAEGMLVTFVGEAEGKYHALFYVRPYGKEDSKFRFANQRPLSSVERAQFRAREVTRRAITTRCSDRYNSIVLKDPFSDSWLVYWLAATLEHGVIPIGGHYRFTVSFDGSTIEHADKLSASCLKLDKKKIPPDTDFKAFVVSHVVSDTPIETHVFYSLLHDVDIAVATPENTHWMVSKGKISVIPKENGANK